MLAGLAVSFVLTALASAVYAVILSSLKWAQDIGRSIHKGKKCSNWRRYRARCGTCGVNFLENPQIDDLKCAECEQPLCGRCKAPGCICPICYKKRDENIHPKTGNEGKRRLSFSSFVQSFLKHKDHHGSTESLTKTSLEDHNGRSNVILYYRNQRPTTNKEVAEPEHSDVGYNSSNGWYSDYESDTEPVRRVENWEDNWLFKKKLHMEHMQPLAMFVPNPNKESKARIGGVEVDELSELSDYSDSEIDEIIK